jgi:hypothetical protein
MTLDSTMSFINKDKNATNSAMTNFSREKSQNKSYDDVQDSEWPNSYTTNRTTHIYNNRKRPYSKLRFIVPYVRTQLYKHSFFPDTNRIWKGLSQPLVESTSLETFKQGVLIP